MLEKIKELGISELEAKTLIEISKNIERDYKLLKKGYPIQYLIGFVNFYGMKIKVNKNVLIPRFETETLVEKTIEYIKNKNVNCRSVLDLCTGSGCIAVTLAKKLNLNVDAIDISKKAIAIAKENAKLNNVRINFRKSNLFKKINKKYDIIISNPPYVSKEEKISKIVKYEPKKALFSKENGTKIIKKIIKQSNNFLNEKGVLAIEIGDKQAFLLKKYAKKYFPESNIIIEKDLVNRYRYLFIFKNNE